MSPRALLPNRRPSVSFEFVHEYEVGKPFKYHATVGFANDGTTSEVFLNSNKHDTPLDALARDLGVVLSIALQFHVPLVAMQDAVGRDKENYPASPIGMILDKMQEISSSSRS